MGSALGRHRLVAHSDTPAVSVHNVDVRLSWIRPGALWIEYYVYAAGSFLIPDVMPAARTDGLWHSTCFELFVRPEGEAEYLEFNFSPSSRWAAYSFDSYRTGMREFPAHDPRIRTSRDTNSFSLAIEAMPDLPMTTLDIGISAIIAETDGTKSYWALAHPPGKPDFHHPDCFALTLPAPEAA